MIALETFTIASLSARIGLTPETVRHLARANRWPISLNPDGLPCAAVPTDFLASVPQVKRIPAGQMGRTLNQLIDSVKDGFAVASLQEVAAAAGDSFGATCRAAHRGKWRRVMSHHTIAWRIPLDYLVKKRANNVHK